MRVVAIIQARMGSSRLPGKVTRRLCGRTVLAHVIARAQACSRVSQVVVATTTSPADAEVAREAEHCGAGVFRGSELDVLARYYAAAVEFSAENILRLTADCPLLDPDVLNRLLLTYETARASIEPPDYLSNTRTPSYPKGLDAEVFSFDALERAHREAREPYEREHVTPYLYQHPEKFRIQGIRQDQDLSHHRWTLDTEDDWCLIETIYTAIGCDRELFSTAEVLALLAARPELSQINAHVRQKQLGE